MSVRRVFVKLGGSYITDKDKPETMREDRVLAAARMLRKAVDETAGRGDRLSLILGHGAGSFGHIQAKEYDAVAGIHPEKGWEGLHRIRESMARMNALFLELCSREDLFPVTVSPFAVAQAKDGRVSRIDAANVVELLRRGQIPLIHGDVIPDTKRGFTIASTEMLMSALADHVQFDEVVMAAKTAGVLDDKGGTVPVINRANFAEVARHLRGSSSPDVTGGMKAKIEGLLSLVDQGKARFARIIRCADDPELLYKAVLGLGAGGTLIASADQDRASRGD